MKYDLTGLPPMNILAFSGPKFSGKDTAAKRLEVINTRLGADLFVKKSFAAVPKFICQLAAGFTDDECNATHLKERELDRWPYEKPRQLMMDVPNWFRDRLDGYVWVRAWLRRVTPVVKAYPDTIFVITDLRFPEEVGAVTVFGGKIVYIERPEASGALREAQQAGDTLALNPSEAHYDFIRRHAAYQIYNDGDLNDLYTKVDTMVAALFPPKERPSVPTHAPLDILGINEYL